MKKDSLISHDSIVGCFYHLFYDSWKNANKYKFYSPLNWTDSLYQEIKNAVIVSN